ncbi:bifunctional DNA primase/helicase [Billgrantia desiderata SP1]|uniref:toprim domain-containing protein n=1 Tax=Billgrantia desiderata TaxID=52021 RepID=UPI000A3B911B|nr:toprim domain-containing protein [Halomonas desiderata]OUE39116.1 bifunctional DNA primase/helicase [Halomonas desiderata SP1]
MDNRLRDDIVTRLIRDFEAEERGTYLQKVRCPECGKREAFIKSDAPWMVKCGRENKCGSQVHVKELFPELFDSWSERFANLPPVPGKAQSSTPVADAYLSMGRGFELERIQGWYTQESFFDPKIDAASATVRFTLGAGVWWERLIDKPARFGKQKANFRGSYRGQWWCPPAVELAAVDELWIVEGIFDAIALNHHGIAAVSAMSCNNYPEKALEALDQACRQAGRPRPTLVWALDTGKAGQEWTLKLIRRARAAGWECEASQPSEGRDWNDLHQRGELTEKHLEEYRYNGALLIAPSANDKALLIYEKTERREFPFVHRSQTYWFKLDLDKYQKIYSDLIDGDRPMSERQARDKALEQSGAIKRIANCHPRPLYFQRNALTDESWYYYRIEYPGERYTVKNTVTGSALASATEFKKRLLSIAPGAQWTGSTEQLDATLAQHLPIRTVETINFVGYAREYEAYVLGDFAVKGGKIYQRNDEDFFELGRTALKTLSQSTQLHINNDPNDYRTDWAGLIQHAFGSKGVVALAFWLGTLFAEQIRSRDKSFPFLEIVGEAGAGKSTLIEFMWKLLGRNDEEGFDPAKSSAAGRARRFVQVANLPVVLIESDRDAEGGNKARQFDWDELKTAYNGRSVRATGVKNMGSDTYEPPFRGAIVISQNAAVAGSDAIMQRIVHLFFTKEGQTRETFAAAKALEGMKIDHVSRFILEATSRESELLGLYAKQMSHYFEQIHAMPEVRSLRIAQNHAQIAALVDCLGPKGLGLFTAEAIAQAHHLVAAMAIERQQAINADHPLVEEFWETVEYLERTRVENVLDHNAGQGYLAINLKEFEKLAADHHFRFDMRELKRQLKGSKARKFVASNHPVYSKTRPNGGTVKCWLFERG